MPEQIKVAIAGINGRFGRAAARMIMDLPEFQLTGAFGRSGASYAGLDIGTMIGLASTNPASTSSASTGILISNSIEDLCTRAKPDVLLDFTVAGAAFEHSKFALEQSIRVVVGTSGIGKEKIKALAEIANRKQVGAFVVPNFSIGAVLMMEFARQAAHYFDNVEIVEMHHTRKLDAPSGTAMHTVRKLEELGKTFNPVLVDEHELLANSRGGRSQAGVHVHALRLPGLLSHQEVIFGADGELLTIRHDGLAIDSYLRGIKLALQAVMSMSGMVVGLDKILSLGGKAQD